MVRGLDGIASGPSDLFAGLMNGGPAWPEVVGFDFTDIDRAITFGTPPSNGTVLVGSFDPSAIGAAYAARGYTSSAAGEHALLCPEAGCDTGLALDLKSIDPRIPFGGRLGRSEPLAVAPSDLLSSADAATIDEMLAAADGSTASVADLDAFRAERAQAGMDDAIGAGNSSGENQLAAPVREVVVGARVEPGLLRAVILERRVGRIEAVGNRPGGSDEGLLGQHPAEILKANRSVGAWAWVALIANSPPPSNESSRGDRSNWPN